MKTQRDIAPVASTVNRGKAALGGPSERSSASACSQMKLKSAARYSLLAVALLGLVAVQLARALESSVPQPSQSASAKPVKSEATPAGGEQQGIGAELAKETREATGADEEEENANLKHAAPVRWLARKTGMSVHQAHMVALTLNFAIIVLVVFWAAGKFVPGILRDRNASIQRALEEARAASHDANRRLVDIENRLRQLDVEIGRMQAAAEKEATAEEARIQQAAEEDVRKVVRAAEQEIAAAAKQARRELSNHTATLAIALARQQINLDSNTDQVLVRNFAANLAHEDAHKDGGKDGR